MARLRIYGRKPSACCGVSSLRGEVVRGLVTLDGPDHRIRHREEHHFEQRLVDVSDDDVVRELRTGDDPVERDRAEHHSVCELTDHGGADEPCPERLFIRAFLDLHQHVRVEELADEIAGDTRDHDSRNKPKNGLECFLMLVSSGRRRELHCEERDGGQNAHREAEQDRALRRGEPVHLRKDVANDVREGKEEESTIHDEWTEGDEFGSADVRNQQHRDEDAYKVRVEALRR